MNVARYQSTSYVVLYTEFSERFPTYFLSHHIRGHEQNEEEFYLRLRRFDIVNLSLKWMLCGRRSRDRNGR
jgi:hypothetical protein